jgi:adenosylhomocysteine nucleosidase
MSDRIAIIAALPREIAGLVRGMKAEPGLLSRGIHLHLLPNAVVVAAGMGAERATHALDAARSCSPLSVIFSVGLAGGCSMEATAGSVLEAGSVIDARSGASYRADSGTAVLVTTATIAGVHEKARLHDAYGASLVDMEAATLARLAMAHGLHFRAIKAVSDGHDFELASLARFTGKHGSFRTGAFAMHTAVRPRTWAKAAQLGQNSSRALVALHGVLRQIVDRS